MGLRGPKLIFASLVGYTVLPLIQFLLAALLVTILGTNESLGELFSAIFINYSFLLRLGITAILWFVWVKINRDFVVELATVFIVFAVLFLFWDLIFSDFGLISIVKLAIAFGFFYGGIEARNYN